MRCWQILQLEPTTDIRAIKKAYAVLLKLNKPDENPAGFQQLHAAYQQALDWADRHADAAPVRRPAPVTLLPPDTQPAAATEPAVAQASPPATAPELLRPVTAEPLPDQTGPFPPPPLIQPEYPDATDDFDTEEPLSPEEEAWEHYLDLQWDSLVDGVELLLAQPEQRNLPAAWEFLTHSEAFMDIEFKAEFSLRFLQRLVEMYRQQKEDGIAILLPDTVEHLNRTFWWDERRQQLEEYFEPDELDEFLAWWQPPPAMPGTTSATETPTAPPPPYANYYHRWLALLLDVTLLGATGLLANRLGRFEEDMVLFALLFTVFGYALLNPLFEASPLQGSPGKYWCGMKVCDRDGKRIALWRAAARTVLFIISMRFIFFTVIINLLIWDGRLLQDRLSGSMVLKRNP